MLPFSAACERNKDPILEVLRERFVDCREVLEVGSGTGQHAVFFSTALPHLSWHPTEQSEYLPDLTSRVALEGPANLLAPALLDVRQAVWPVRNVDAVFTANTLHIMSWPQVTAFFSGVSNVLAPRGVLCIYGPFRYQGRYTSDSNQAFDRMLQERDAQSGLREMTDMCVLATQAGLRLDGDYDLPAHNRLLAFVREP